MCAPARPALDLPQGQAGKSLGRRRHSSPFPQCAGSGPASPQRCTAAAQLEEWGPPASAAAHQLAVRPPALAVPKARHSDCCKPAGGSRAAPYPLAAAVAAALHTRGGPCSAVAQALELLAQQEQGGGWEELLPQGDSAAAQLLGSSHTARPHPRRSSQAGGRELTAAARLKPLAGLPRVEALPPSGPSTPLVSATGQRARLAHMATPAVRAPFALGAWTVYAACPPPCLFVCGYQNPPACATSVQLKRGFCPGW